MIEIKARLVREQTAVFLAGESIECFVTFTNPQRPQHKIAQSNRWNFFSDFALLMKLLISKILPISDILENLAWATVSIQCYCNTTLRKDKLLDDATTASTSLATSLSKQGTLVAAAQPKFLFCDLRLEPGETKSCKFASFYRKIREYFRQFFFCYRFVQRWVTQDRSTHISGRSRQVFL